MADQILTIGEAATRLRLSEARVRQLMCPEHDDPVVATYTAGGELELKCPECGERFVRILVAG